MLSHLSCGIDFGTSNSTCALTIDNKISLIDLENGKQTLPSALFFCADGTPLFGRQAIQAYIEGQEGRLMRGLKSVLGTELMNEKTFVRGKPTNFTDILAIYIRHLKNHAEETAGHPIDNVIMGRPVHFHDDDAEADRQSQNTLESIAKMIGFKNILFQYEPIAAAFAHEQNVAQEKLSLVIDLGGGTSDFTVIRLSKQKATQKDRSQDILGTTGVRVGGTNFDQRLSMLSFMPHLGLGTTYRSDFDASKILDVPTTIYMSLSEWARVNSMQTNKAITATRSILRTSLAPEKIERLLKLQENTLGHVLLQEVERSKIALTDKASAKSDLTPIGLNFNVTVTAKKFEDCISACIDKIAKSLNECLKQAAVAPQDIGLVILTGGSSELPIVNRLVQATFPNAELSQDNKLGSVGLGLAYNARAAF